MTASLNCTRGCWFPAHRNAVRAHAHLAQARARLLISQAEDEREARGGIDRVSFAGGRLKTRLRRRMFRSAVEVLEPAGTYKGDAGCEPVRCHGHIEYHRSLFAAAPRADGVGWPDRAVERRVRIDVA